MTPELTPAQRALIIAISDYDAHRTDALNLHTLATHPELTRLGLDAMGIEAELKAAPSGLFMTKATRNMAAIRYWTLAFRGLAIAQAEQLGGHFFAPAKAPEKSSGDVQAAPASLAPAPLTWQPGDRKSLSTLEQAPAVGTVQKEGEEYTIVTAHSKEPFYLSRRVIEDEDLFEYEGKACTYVYTRPATDVQVAAHEAELSRLAARTPEQVLAEEPMQPSDLISLVMQRGKSAGREAPAGDVIYSEPGYFGSSALTLIRTASGVALHSHNRINGPAHDTVRHLDASQLSPVAALALSRFPARNPEPSQEDDDEWETL